MLACVLATIRREQLLAPGERVLVALSGGPDSTALLHVLLELASRLGVTLSAATVDHGLRAESAREAREVARGCRRLGLACAVLTVDVGRARRRHGSLQEAAREARLGALVAAAARSGCTKIALGHTADDQAETILFRILRGTGIAGLAGMAHQRGSLIRPLLDARRAQILRYLGKRKLPFVIDPSNANRRYARVRIRHEVLPFLARENPRVVEALLQLGRQARAIPARGWLATLPPGRYVPQRTLEIVDRLAAQGRGTRRVAAAGGAIVVGYGQVRWEPLAAPERPSSAAVRVRRPGVYRLAAPPALAVDIRPPLAGPAPSGNAACFDPARVGWPLVLRAPSPGDRMRPRGGRGSRKLSDLLIDAKIPREERVLLPVLCEAGGAILFVPGLRPSEVGRPDAVTREWFEVRVTR